MVFVVIDGMDGSGKSTQAKKLCKLISQQGKTYIIRTHPSNDNFFGRMSRGYLLLEGIQARISASIFYLLDVLRSVILFKWKPVDYVIFVRYLMGTAYLPKSLYKFGYHFFKTIVPKPNHMIFIDVTPEEAFKRIQENRERKEMFESLEKLVETRNKVLKLARTGDWMVINGNKTKEFIHKKIAEELILP
jgi:dTMP kinase